MKIAIRLYLILIPLMCSTLYGAQQPTEAEFYGKILGEFWVKSNGLDPATLKKLQQEETERVGRDLAKSSIQAYIRCGEKIPKKSINQADPETAALAHQHNQRIFSEQLLQAQQPK